MSEDELIAVINNSNPAPPEPSEFITNGAFSSGADWTIISAGWVIAAGVATSAIVGNARKLQQDFGALVQPLVSGNNYVLSFDCDNGVGVSMVNVWVDTGAFSGLIYSNAPSTGTVTIPFAAVDNSTTFAIAVGPGEPTGLIIDNVSLVPA